MSKVKMIEANYNAETGVSIVTIDTPYGKFFGKSILHPEDVDIKSNFQGCKYAEMRAIVKYGKERSKKIKNELHTLEVLVNNMEKLKDYNKDSREARFIRKQYYIKRKEYNDLMKDIDKLNNLIFNEMQNYRKNVEDLYKKVEKNREKRNSNEPVSL